MNHNRLHALLSNHIRIQVNRLLLIQKYKQIFSQNKPFFFLSFLFCFVENSPSSGNLNGDCETASNKCANADEGISVRNFELHKCFVSMMLQ